MLFWKVPIWALGGLSRKEGWSFAWISFRAGIGYIQTTSGSNLQHLQLTVDQAEGLWNILGALLPESRQYNDLTKYEVSWVFLNIVSSVPLSFFSPQTLTETLNKKIKSGSELLQFTLGQTTTELEVYSHIWRRCKLNNPDIFNAISLQVIVREKISPSDIHLDFDVLQCHKCQKGKLFLKK